MAVLKNIAANRAIKDAIVLDMADLREQAAGIIADARREAKAIVDEALKQEKDIAAQAHDEAFAQGQQEGEAKGLAEGLEQGRTEARQQMQDQLEQLQQVWVAAGESWEADRREIERETNRAVLGFAELVAKKVVHRVIEVDQQVAVDQVAGALQHVLGPMDVTVHICPSDRPTVEHALPKLAERMGQFEHVRLVDDEAVGPGGCMVSYGQGRIDATIEKQVDRLTALLWPGADDDERAPVGVDIGSDDAEGKTNE